MPFDAIIQAGRQLVLTTQTGILTETSCRRWLNDNLIHLHRRVCYEAAM